MEMFSAPVCFCIFLLFTSWQSKHVKCSVVGQVLMWKSLMGVWERLLGSRRGEGGVVCGVSFRGVGGRWDVRWCPGVAVAMEIEAH